MLAAAALSCGACAPHRDSPRPPYAVPSAAARAGGESSPFRVIESWRWTAAPRLRDGAESPADALRGGAESPVDTLRGGPLGLFDARQFRPAVGGCTACGVPAAAFWWFRDELVAVPAPRSVLGTEGAAEPPAAPALLWLGAPEVVEHARLSADARSLTVGSETIPFAVAPKIATSTAYVDASTARFFAARPIRVRGATAAVGGRPVFVARTIWPEDARLELDRLPLEPLTPNELLGTLIEAQIDATRDAFPARLLFERDPGGRRRWAGRPVLAFVLSGAQADDDGSLSGHLAAATGVIGPHGEWHHWLATNFYPLADRNAKGILPATLPIDNYLFDLNSGQLYYRPAYMLVAVLSRERAALAVHESLQRTMLALYCGRVEFNRASFNSTAMTIDALRGLGWRIPRTGPTSRLAGIAAAPFAALVGRKFRTGRDLYAALSEERTRLLPRVAFEVAGHDLLYLAAGGGREDEGLTPFERMLAEDVEAIVFVRLPQVPSARRYGTYPVRSLLAYGARLLSDPAPYEAAPDAGTRELPERMKASCGPQ